MDNLSPTEKDRLQVIRKVQGMLAAGFGYKEVAAEAGICTRTVARYREGEPEMMCRRPKPLREKAIASLKGEIVGLLREGYHASGVYRELVKRGHAVHKTTVTAYVRELSQEEGIVRRRYRKGPAEASQGEYLSPVRGVKIKKGELQKYLWTDKCLGLEDMGDLYEKYPIIGELKKCIREFREIFYRKNMAYLYVFIEDYKSSPIPAIKSFAQSLEKDIEAVENAVASPLSNGFVEGVNNRTKAIKRVMYGRCGIKLLTAKIMLGKQGNNG